jgi:hypothetical protein
LLNHHPAPSSRPWTLDPLARSLARALLAPAIACSAPRSAKPYLKSSALGKSRHRATPILARLIRTRAHPTRAPPPRGGSATAAGSRRRWQRKKALRRARWREAQGRARRVARADASAEWTTIAAGEGEGEGEARSKAREGDTGDERAGPGRDDKRAPSLPLSLSPSPSPSPSPFLSLPSSPLPARRLFLFPLALLPNGSGFPPPFVYFFYVPGTVSTSY